MIKKVFLLSLILFLGSTTNASNRVTYTRPGDMLKIPSSSLSRSPYLFQTGFGSEIHNFSPLNTSKGGYFNMETGKSGFLFGFSFTMAADTTQRAHLKESSYTAPVEFGFHIQKRVYTYQDVSISLGLQDIVFQNTEESSQLSLNSDELSLFAVVSSEKEVGSYKMNTYLGFGTGSLGPISTPQFDDDGSPQTVANDTGSTAGVFVGFILNTPYFARWGGIDLVGEFDGTGINVGLRIPLTSDYRLNLGFTHIDKLPHFGDSYWAGHPGVTLGLDMAVPRAIIQEPVVQRFGGPSPFVGDPRKLYPIEGETITAQRDSTLRIADFVVHSLRDSMSLMNNEMRNLIVQLSAMEQNSMFLEDSLKSLKLDQNVQNKNENDALRHLSRSLRFFYTGDYRGALQEVEAALELNPNLALAYARRGSIYYKLGDVQRATIDWNLALRLDAEYDDVRNILKALHENRLRTTSVIKE
tara:strand:+ start:1743 stop:3149 length:1407 start_codon:yes stop_codon:yes gene_type:complete